MRLDLMIANVAPRRWCVRRRGARTGGPAIVAAEVEVRVLRLVSEHTVVSRECLTWLVRKRSTAVRGVCSKGFTSAAPILNSVS